MCLLYIKSLDVPRIGVICCEMDVQASRLPVRKNALSYAFELHAINGFDLEQVGVGVEGAHHELFPAEF